MSTLVRNVTRLRPMDNIEFEKIDVKEDITLLEEILSTPFLRRPASARRHIKTLRETRISRNLSSQDKK